MGIDMRPVKKEGNGIRRRLLEVACEIFAQKGYRDATIAEICKRAGANVAAVNYYFGNKKTLYVETWRLAFHRSLEAHSPGGGVPSDAPAEERLRGRILAIMQRLADPKSHEFEIIRKEMANPTGLLAEVMRKSIEPLRREFGSIVRELLGKYASEQQVMLCQMSIKAQCFDMTVRERHHKMFTAAGIKGVLLPERLKIEVMADHVARFSLAGIREIRRQQIEGGKLVSR
jgi:AcrR family transcriptional regulator